MVENYKIYPLRVTPGIKRDGTQNEGTYWNDGRWTRFYRGLPRSMLGYRSMTSVYPGPSRGLFINLNPSGYIDVFSGSASNLTVGQFTTGGFGGGVTDITPAGFATSSNNIWQLDSFYNQNGSGYSALIAHAAPNLTNISNSIATSVYYGNILSTAALTKALDDLGNAFTISGGILALPPYTIAYGSSGLVQWSALNDPTTFPIANAANPTATKIVKGLAIKSGNSAPACVLWSLDSIIVMTFVGGNSTWTFQTITDQSSILSSSGPVEFDGIFYWPGIDRWLTYNGTVRELPNGQSLDFFYKNLNYAYRQKVFGFKIPHWGEVCWCAPMFGATEPNWMFVYNVRENTWYDTPLPYDGRSAAIYAQAWQYPVMFGAKAYQGGYNLWQHEFGYDEIIGNQINAIQSYITSPPISIVSGGLTAVGSIASQPSWTQLVGFEPDFNFNKSMTFQILTRQFAQDSDTMALNQTITAGGVNYFDNQIQARYIRWVFGANSQGGYYQMGTPNILYREGDRTP